MTPRRRARPSTGSPAARGEPVEPGAVGAGPASQGPFAARGEPVEPRAATPPSGRASLGAVAGVLDAAARDGVAPAAAAVVRAGGAVVHASVHGAIPDGGEPRALRDGDLFDVASLTKPLASATLAARLVADGALDLDAPVADRLPAFGAAGKARVTARHLLAHAAGLVAWRPWWERAAADPVAGAAFLPPAARPPPEALARAFARGRALVAEAVLAEPLEAPPGTRAVYSDAGFVALGLLLEAVAGAPLAALAERLVFAPLGLASTFFLDGVDPGGARARAAGRAFAPARRSAPRGGEVVRGAVDDDNAWAMGGVAGHAGVFSTAGDVAALGQAWLDAVQGRPSIVPADAARAFARRDPTPGSGRALGWDTPGPPDATSLGARLGRGPRGAIGHLGFTGCSLWIDLDAGVVCALLTNHVHPGGPDRPRLLALRRAFHDAVADGLGIG